MVASKTSLSLSLDPKIHVFVRNLKNRNCFAPQMFYAIYLYIIQHMTIALIQMPIYRIDVSASNKQ